MQKITYHPLAARPHSAAPMDALDFISNTLINVRRFGEKDEIVFDRSGQMSALKSRSGLLSRIHERKDTQQKADAIAHFVNAFESFNAHHHANSAVGNSRLRSYLDQVKKGEVRLTAGLFAQHLDACRIQLLDKIAPGPVVSGRPPISRVEVPQPPASLTAPAAKPQKPRVTSTTPRTHSPKPRAKSSKLPLSSGPYSPGTMRDPARFNKRFDQDLQELEALLGRDLFAADNG